MSETSNQVRRINRQLAPLKMRMVTSGSSGEKSNCGAFYLLNTAKNEVIYTQVDPDELERELPSKQPRSWGYILRGEEKTA